MEKHVHVFFGFRHGKLETVILSVDDNVESAIDCNYYIPDPQEAEKQIKKWIEEEGGVKT